MHSDGELSPTGVVNAAADAGVELLALTDHDSIAGVAEAAAAARARGIGLVSGVEISVLDPAAQDLHILGYGIDVEHPGLLAQLERSRLDRTDRAARIVARLQELGFAVDEELLAARARGGQTVGRPHLAEAVVRHPANAQRLRAEGLTEPTPFLVAYLIEGTPGFLPREAPAAADAIALIHAAGGVAIWAHPFWDVEAEQEVLDTIDRFVALGLDGVEAFYVTHGERQTTLLLDRCEQLGLLSTGSSDFHGPGHRQFNRFRAFETHGRRPSLGPIAALSHSTPDRG